MISNQKNTPRFARLAVRGIPWVDEKFKDISQELEWELPIVSLQILLGSIVV